MSVRSGLRRTGAFASVATIGFVVQASAIVALTSLAGWHITAATAAGVLLAIVHNFVLHARWTWADRDRSARVLTRLARFTLATGSLSLVGTVALTTLYAWLLGAPVLVSNLLAVVSVGALNFLLLDKVVFREVS